MERTEYPAMLAALAPSQAVEVLNERVGHVGRLNIEIADWLAERRRLEEAYANGLRKLARRPIQGIDLGVFSVPWSSLTNATETQADSHASLASKIDVDVERPLRDFTKSSRELQAISTMQGNIGAMAKEVDQAQLKVEKLQGRGERDTSKSTSAYQELERAQTQWDSQAPYVFENLQTLDEARLNHLRDVLTQLQTHEVDQVEKDRVSAEQCLNALLNVEIADEIKTFQLKAVASRPRAERPSRQATGPLTPPMSASTGRPNLAPTLSQTSANENASERTGSVQEEKKGPLKGLKRLSTVMGRKKDRTSKLPSQLEPMAEESGGKRGFGGFGRKKKDASSLDVPQEASSLQRPYSPLRIGSEAFEPTELRESPAAHINGVAEHTPQVAAALPNGSYQGDLADLEPPRPGPAPRTDSLPKQDSEGFSLPSNDIDPITRAQQEAAATGESLAPQYNVNIRDAPIAEERNIDSDAALASMASKLQMQAPPPQRRGGTVRGRRDGARNSAYIPPSEIPSTTAEPPVPSTSFASGQAFNPSASTSSFISPIPFDAAASTSPAFAQPFNPSTSTSTSPQLGAPAATFNPSASTSSAFSSLPIAQEAALPFKPAQRSLNADGAGDNHSIRSGRSLASTASQGHKHPDLTVTGLNVSIIENLSAQFEGGKVLSSSLIGEIAMAYNPADFSTPFTTENIKLSNFTTLEKVAPNPAFVNPSPAGREGEYSLNLASLSKTQIAFKYQARLDDAETQAPLLLTTAFKIEPTQASVIVSYSLNPAFAHTGPLRLSNVMLALTLEGGRATGCQSKPVGTFSREKNIIFWQLGDVMLTPGATPSKLLARFATESEAKTGSIEARWEILGEQVSHLGSGLAITAQGQSSATDGSDPFADESMGANYKPVHTVRKLASANYSAR